MVVNVKLQTDEKHNRYELLAWLNDALQTRFTKVEQTCSGAAFCQLMDWLCPGSVDMKKVKFQVKEKMDILHNCNLLQIAFRKNGITQSLPIEGLIEGNSQDAFNLLRWFKVFFDRNYSGREYSALEARDGQSMLPFSPKKPRALNHLDFSKEGEISLNLEKALDTQTDPVSTDVEMEAEDINSFSCSLSTLRFIGKHLPGTSGSAGSLVSCRTARLVLGQRYPEDITATCSQTPYCLYLYRGVDLGEGERASVVLVGLFDQGAGTSRLRLLDVIQPREDTEVAELACLVDTLKKFEIPIANLAAFYANVIDPEQSKVFILGLRLLNPAVVSLCDLTGMAAQACHTGVMATGLSDQVQELIKEVFQHYSSCPATKESLTELFTDVEALNLTLPTTTQCLSFSRMLSEMSSAWSDLVQYFGSLDAGNSKQARSLLGEQRLRLTFLFLSSALEPLRVFQKTVERGAELGPILQDASALLHCYASSFLRPPAVERYLRRGDAVTSPGILEHLPRGEVKVGAQVEEFLLEHEAELAGCLELFHESTISFFAAVTSTISMSLPLPDLALRNMAAILSPMGKLEVTGRAVADLGSQFGICQNQEDTTQLTDEYLEYQLSEGEEQTPNSPEPPVEQYWKDKLRIMGKRSILRRLILSLLALPRTLEEEKVFAQVFEGFDECPLGKSRAEKEMEFTEEQDAVLDDDITDSSSYKSALSHPVSPGKPGSCSSSSDVIDLTEVEPLAENMNPGPIQQHRVETKENLSEKQNNTPNKEPNLSESIVIDDDDDDIIWTDTSFQEVKENITSTPNKIEKCVPYQDGKDFIVGELVWGQVEGFSMWPGQVQSWKTRKAAVSMRKVEWFGDGMFSEIHIQGLLPFSAFARCFCTNSFTTMPTYKEAIRQSLQLAAERCGKVWSLESDSRDDFLKVMLDWAFGGFKPTGPEGFRPLANKHESQGVIISKSTPGNKVMSTKSTPGKQRFANGKEDFPSSMKMSFNSKPNSEMLSNLKQVSVCLNKLSLDLENGSLDLKDEVICRKLMPLRWQEEVVKESPIADDQPPPKKQKNVLKIKDLNKDQNQAVEQENDYNREEMVHKVLAKGKNIEGFCLSCGTPQIEIFHPLFEGSLCLKCKENFTETLFRYDEDGYQSYCTVCCGGLEVILCGKDSCCRSYCVDCLNILVGAGTFDRLKDMDPWTCYLCEPELSSGALKPRHDWSIRVQEFFANNSAMEFEPHRVYPSIPANLRRPIKVLSLFDGIATGYLVLRDLGFKVEKYVASEVCDESITVSMVNHDYKIIQVDDVRFITKEHIDKWGPFDLLIGGSPCNDLSIVNPARKGLYEGTGRLFFEYYRLLNIMKPKEEDARPFFWLFENVVFMNRHDKYNICRFLECNPVLIDAVKVSPAHRARYFWGNLPGMNRPIIATQSDKLTLQDCLEVGRTAKYAKVRTITTKTNSLKQGPNEVLCPVIMNGKGDTLWSTELEKIFGFPKHYTDVKNMGRLQRQKVLGKSWSVPVIRHLFAPLKDYFACDTD